MRGLLFGVSLSLASTSLAMSEEDALAALSRSDNLPHEALDNVSDSYLEGYIQALVDLHYYEYEVIVIAKDQTIFLAHLPKNELFYNSIIAFVKDVPGVKEVKVLEDIPEGDESIAKRERAQAQKAIKGVWFPQSTELYQPMVADPRLVVYSVGYRGGDRVSGDTAIPISMGDDFPIFRWLDVFKWRGDLQIGIEACIWSVFDMNVKGYNPDGGAELVNSDFYVALPLTYAINKWSFRLRGYHISSHLGDEFLVNNPEYVTNVPIPGARPKRVNPSYEAIDFFTSYQWTDEFRIYGGPGIIVHSDPSFPMKTFYAEYGAEYRFWGVRMYYHRLYGNCFAAVHFRTAQYINYDFDGTLVLGYEWSKLQNVGRKIRIFGQFHHGFSLEGQFMKERTTYGGLIFAYGF